MSPAEPTTYVECLLEGKKVPFDVCRSEGTVEQAKKDYPNHKYIGSGKVTFHDGVRNDWKTEIHFFIKKNK